MKKAILVGALAIGTWPVSVAAQDAAPKPGAAESAGEAAQSGYGIEDIVVTAQKRSENIQDVPIAITALTSGDLASNRTASTTDLQMAVPSLVYNSLASFAQPFMRGIGSDITGPNADPAVATYVDGAFISTNTAVIQNLLGVERVEVLQGPQGTLYGRNAVGGAINIYTLTPTQDLDVFGSITGGNYRLIEGSAHISGGLTPDLAVGLYAGISDRHTFLDRIYTGPANDFDNENSLGVRGKFVYAPAGSFKLTGSVEYTRRRSFEDVGFRQVNPLALGFLFGADPIIKRGLVLTDTPVHSRNEQYAATLREEVDLGWAQILGISNYRNVKSEVLDDPDATTQPVIALGQFPLRSKQFSQELQLLSPTSSRVQWIAGVYYFQERGGYDPTVQISSLLFGPTIRRIETFGFAKVRSYAAFAQITVPLGDRVRITAGGRYTIDKKRFTGSQAAYDGSGGLIVGSERSLGPSEKTWRKFTPKVTFDYKVDDTLLYASYSKGFKSGAYNLATFDPVPADPETLDAFEAGMKSDLFDHHLRINLAGYYYKYKGLQVQVIDAAGAGLTRLQNAANATLYGAEASAQFAVTPEFTLNGSVAWQHTRYDDFANFSGVLIDPNTGALYSPAGGFDVSGNQLQRAPKWVFSVGAQYEHELGDGSKLGGRINLYHNSGYYWEPGNSFREPSYSLLNGSVDYTFMDGRMSASVWAKNITNTYYRAFVLPLAGLGEIDIDALPRTFGVTLSYHLQ